MHITKQKEVGTTGTQGEHWEITELHIFPREKRMWGTLSLWKNKNIADNGGECLPEKKNFNWVGSDFIFTNGNGRPVYKPILDKLKQSEKDVNGVELNFFANTTIIE